MNPAPRKEEETREACRLRSLYEVSKILNSSLELKEIYPKIRPLIPTDGDEERGDHLFEYGIR